MNIARTLALLLAGASFLATNAAAQPVKVGMINMVRLEKESAISIRSGEILKQEFEPRRVQAEELVKRAEAARERLKNDLPKLSPADARNRDREVTDLLRRAEQGRARFLEELEVRKNEMRAKFIEETNVAIKIVAEAGKYDLILHKAAFARPATDVTPLVLKEMAKRSGSLR